MSAIRSALSVTSGTGRSSARLRFSKNTGRMAAPPEETSVGEEDELSMALDALTIAHFAATFEFVSGPHKWW